VCVPSTPVGYILYPHILRHDLSFAFTQPTLIPRNLFPAPICTLLRSRSRPLAFCPPFLFCLRPALLLPPHVPSSAAPTVYLWSHLLRDVNVRVSLQSTLLRWIVCLPLFSYCTCFLSPYPFLSHCTHGFTPSQATLTLLLDLRLSCSAVTLPLPLFATHLFATHLFATHTLPFTQHPRHMLTLSSPFQRSSHMFHTLSIQILPSL